MNELQFVALTVLALYGEELKHWMTTPLQARREIWLEQIKDRVRRTTDSAEAKAGDRPLSINDRVAFKALTEATITDDDITLEYVAGVIAGSSKDDDSGAAVVAQIGRLSAASLRLHYIIYRELRRLWPGEDIRLHQTTEANKVIIHLSLPDLISALGERNTQTLGKHITPLEREALIYHEYSWGPKRAGDLPLEQWELVVRPSAVGAELFLWGHGRDLLADAIFDPALDLVFLPDIPATPSTKVQILEGDLLDQRARARRRAATAKGQG